MVPKNYNSKLDVKIRDRTVTNIIKHQEKLMIFNHESINIREILAHYMIS